jgi:3-oxoadipate enol-lactonase
MSAVAVGALTIFDGVPFYYQADGVGAPVILLHAGVADSRMWDAHWASLTQSNFVIRCDLPGYGQSGVPDQPFSYPAQVLRLLDHLQIDRVHVVGVSWGGSVALDVALMVPERVASLTLVCPSVNGAPESEELRQFSKQEEALLEQGDLDAAVELNVRTWVDGPFREANEVDPAIRDAVREMQRHAFTVPVPEGAELIRLQPPAYQHLEEVSTRTLVLVGALDLAPVVALAAEVAERIPDAQLLTFPDTAHMLPMEQPEVFVRVLRSFWEE